MSTSTPHPVQTLPTLPAQPFRLDVPLHDLLQKPSDHSSLARAEHEPQTSLSLPSPVFPQHPGSSRVFAHDPISQVLLVQSQD